MKCVKTEAHAAAAFFTFLFPSGETIQGLRANLKEAIETLSLVDSSVAISSGGELFLRFISLTSLENPVSFPQLFNVNIRHSASEFFYIKKY